MAEEAVAEDGAVVPANPLLSPPSAAGPRSLRLLPWAVLAVALVVAWLPLASPETIAGHSAMSDRVRAAAIHAAVEGGDLLPAWLPDLYDRHGTPLPSFYSPLSYAVVELLRRAGAGPETAFQISYLLFWIVGSAGSAVAARRRFGEGAGLPAAAAFALAPYTLVDAYVRSGLAEFAALALLPWALAAVVGPEKRYEAEAAGTSGASESIRARGAGGLALTVVLLVLTHNITALVAVPALALLVLLGPRDRRRSALTGIALGLSLSLFFWLPALVEKRWLWSESSLTSGFFDYGRHFVAPLDLLPGRASLRFTVGPSTGLPYRFGELLFAAVAVGLVVAARRGSPGRAHTLPLAAGAAVALLLTSSWSEPLWRLLPLASFVQFPFRFFLFATVFAVPLVGACVVRTAERWRPIAAASAIALSLLLARPWLEVRYLFIERANGRPVPVLDREVERAKSDPRFSAVDAWITLDRLRSSQWSGSAGNEFLPRPVTRLPSGVAGEVPTATAEALAPGIRVVGGAWAYPEISAELEVGTAGDVALHQFWFPGWRAEVDGEAREIRAEPERGRIVVAVRPGDRRLHARYGWTALRRGAAAASLFALVLGLVVVRREWIRARAAARSR